MWNLSTVIIGGKEFGWSFEYSFNRETGKTEARLTFSQVRQVTINDYILLADSIAVAGDVVFPIPIIGEIGWLVSGLAGTTSYILTVNNPQATEEDMAFALMTASTGWVPWPGGWMISGAQYQRDLIQYYNDIP
jgi:hypothetical protein